MKRKTVKTICICAVLLLLSLFATPKCDASSSHKNFCVDKNKYRLVKMLVLSRHNIRSPLSGGSSVLSEVTNHKWFDWSSRPSELSLRGGNLESEMGQYFRKYLVDRGLMEENWIPTGKTVRIYANSKQRTIATAKIFSSGMFPIANINVEHHGKIGIADPIFSSALTFTSKKYEADVEKQKDELINLADLEDNFELLEKVLDYKQSNYAKKLPKLIATDAKIIFKLKNEQTIKGSLKIALAASDALTLQYYEETDEKKAAFGHDISLKDRLAISEIADTYIHMLFGLPLISINVAHPLLKEINRELLNNERIFTFLCGHDSNIVSVLSALDAKEYRLPCSVERQTPIGGKIVIEKWKDKRDGKEYYSVSYVYQSSEQLRKRPLLDLKNPPVKYRLEFNGLNANSDGLYNAKDIIDRFKAAIKAYDDMVAKYK